ncbi:MAG: DUF2853 family protein [Epsilonproteobacteria bacterium]|nr:DUF2853 family protein [Campylobacterota bacterium]
MSKLDEKIELYNSKIKDMDAGYDADLLAKVTKGLGPSIYNKDAETIACSDASELDRVRESFLKKKLSLTDSDDDLNASIKEVCQKMGTSNKSKYRAIFYYFLAVKYNKQSVYA